MIIGQSVLFYKALPLSIGQLRQSSPDLRHPRSDAKHRQIAFREVSVVVRPHLAPDGYGYVPDLIEVAGFLHHLDVASLQVFLPGDLIGEGFFHPLEAGDVLDLGSVAALEGYVGVHPHRSFQGAVEDLQVLQDALELIQKSPRLLGRSQVWLGYHLQQGHAAAVVVHHGIFRLVNGPGVHQPPRVLLHMGPVDADVPLRPIVAQYHDVPIGGQGKIILADLKSLGQIRVVVVLAVE